MFGIKPTCVGSLSHGTNEPMRRIGVTMNLRIVCVNREAKCWGVEMREGLAKPEIILYGSEEEMELHMRLEREAS